MSVVLTFALLVSLLFPSGAAVASLGDFAVRATPATLDDYDRPFNTTAIIKGRCRDVNIPDSKNIKWIYQRAANGNENERIRKTGIIYINDLGQEVVCFDDLAITPFVTKNVHGEIVSISGWITPGSDYGIAQEEIIVLESMELLKEIFE